MEIEYDQYCYVCDEPLLETDDQGMIADSGDDWPCHARCVDANGYPRFSVDERGLVQRMR